MVAGCHTIAKKFLAYLGFSSLENGGEIMRKNKVKLSIFLSFILVFQLIMPFINGFATELTGTPTNLTVKFFSTNDVYLRWEVVSGAESYRVYKLDNDNKELIATSYNQYWWIPYAEEGQYTISVTSVKNGIESSLSVPVNFEVNFPEVPTPKDLTYSIFNINDVQLRWSSVSNANKYNIYQIIEGQKKWITTTSSATANIYGLKEGDYAYEVTAFNDRFGESLVSNQVKFSIVYPEIKAPTNLTSTIYNSNDINLVWKPVEYATSYNIYSIKDNEKKLVANSISTSKSFLNLAEGEYTYEVSAVSRFGESTQNNQTKKTIIYPDILSPSGFKSTLYNVNDLFLVWSPVEFATNYNIYQISGNEKKLLDTTTSTAKYYYNLAEGDYLYEISAVSNRFGESSNNSQTGFKVIYPILKAPEGLTATNSGADGVKLVWNKSEHATSYKIYEITAREKKLISTVTDTTRELTGLKEGEHIFEVSTLNNRFGESADTARVIINVVYPKGIAPIAKLNVENNSNAKISWEPVAYAGSYNIFKIVDGKYILLENVKGNVYVIAGLSEGVHNFAVSALSNYFGESNYSNMVTADIKPELESPTPETPEVNGNVVKLDWAPVTGANSYNIYIVEDGTERLVANTKETELTIDNLTQGNHEFRIVPVSPAGVEGEKYTTVFVEIEQPDTTPPQTVANEATNWLQNAYEVKLAATDDQSGVAKTFYSINGSEFTVGTSFTVTEEGINKVSFYSVDNAGNIEEVKTTEVKIDKTAPVTNSDIATNWNKGKVKVNLTATDDLSGVAKTFYSIDGSAYTEGNTFTISTEGITQVSFYSVDNAGNKEAAKIEEVMIDNTAPVTKSDITDQWNSDAVKVDLTATDNLSGVAKTYYSINGSEYLEGNSFTVTGEGVIQVSFYSVDNAGNEEAVKTEFVKLDNQAPETVSDVTDRWNTGDVTVNLTATDNESGVATTFYSINGSEFVEGTEITVNQEGINKVSFYSVDNVGTVEVAKTIDVKIDKTAPTTVSNITDEWNQSQVAVKLTATDDLSGVAKTYYSINGTDYVEGTQFTVSQEGINKVSFYSVDNAGNIEDVQTVEVKVDKTAPVVSWNLADQYALGDSLPLAYKATDEHSGIAKETISVNGKVYENTNSVKLDKPGTYEVVVTVTDHAGWTTTIEKTIEVYIPATLIVNPGVIKANAGDFTVKISLPKGYNTNQIDLSTATLNGVSAKSGTNGLVQQAKNGQFKFNRDDFEWKKGMVTVEFRVLVDGILVIGSTTVEVK
jgi:large repetitive protein